MSTPAPARPSWFTHRLFFLLAAVLCFAVALLLSIGAISGGNETAWGYGGLLSLALSLI